jgi:hypothetical protein
MAYYSTFGEILTQMRSEARLSTNPAVSSDADTRYKALVNRVYSTLYESYDWPHLRHVSARVVLAAGQRFYDFPTSIAPEGLETAVAWWADEPYPLDPGIGMNEYAAFDSVGDERADPPQRYALRATAAGTTQFEIWPIPVSNTIEVEFTGKRRWFKLVNPGDICLIDDYLVALRAAAEVAQPLSPDSFERLMGSFREREGYLRARGVLPQTEGSSAPGVGNGEVSVGLRGSKAVVRVGRA